VAQSVSIYGLVSAALLSLGSPALSQTPEQLTFYGLELGKPLSVPECEKRLSISGRQLEYSTTPNFMCAQTPGMPQSTPSDFSRGAVIRFPFLKSPTHLKDGWMSVFSDGGVVQAIRAYTRGLESQESLMRDLTAKYGPPTNTTISKVKTRIGAEFDNITATWDISDSLQVQYLGMLASLDQGVIFVGSKRGLADYLARQKASEQRQPKM
jgi:hypothetical protein